VWKSVENKADKVRIAETDKKESIRKKKERV